ncbi:T9SS type A sorting domain-containing protein [Bacteroidota bacterium]
MKKLFITSVFIGSLLLSAQAQFLMKSNSHLLRAGDEHYFNIAENVDPGNKGPSVIWNYSSLQDKSTLTSYMYSAYTTPIAVDIPEANTVLEEFETKFYFKTSDGIIEQYGTITKNNTITKYDKPFVKMVFPFNYGDIYSGDFSGTVEGANNYKANFTGTYLLKADAYGTLILPGNIIYKNVFRIKTIKEQCYNNNNACNCATISYKWYTEDVRYPLLTIIQCQTSKGIKTIRTAYYSKAENKTEEVNNNQKLVSENIEAKIYPNPFTDEFKLDYSITNDYDVRIEIYDNSGRRVNSIQKINQKAGYYTETITRDDVGNQLGMFHIRIIAGEDVVSKTVIRGE